MNIGILTGGGDCPGLNAVIRAVVRKAYSLNYEVTGIRNGWKGLLDSDFIKLDLRSSSGILHRGGTILGTSRTNPYKHEKGEQIILENIEKLKIDAICAIGGEDTLGVANKLSKVGVKIVGVPKTIDNDLNATDFTFGFDTAVNIAMEAIDRLHTTAESHNRVMVIEVMGRHTGWIALYTGLAGGADVILIPEKPFDLDEVATIIKQRHARGKDFSIVVVSEGAKYKTENAVDKDGSFVLSSLKKDAFGHVRLGGIGNVLAEEIEKRTDFETRATILGHIQRGGSPTAFDRVLGTRFGIKAVELIVDGKFGRMAALRGNQIIDVPLEEAVGTLKTVDLSLYEVAEVFFG
ncbi:MAG: 6-phosphofructokinase [Ignavibacteria bacterium]|nr:6-phosphofructokinase [Ignavibacteria bacterium]